MKLGLRGCDPNAKERAGADAGSIGTLYNFLLDLQEKVIQEGVKNSKKWFGKDRSESLVRETMKLFIAPSVELINGDWVSSGKYPPALKMKVPVYDGKVAMDVVDSMGKPVEVDTENLKTVFPPRVDASIVVAPSIYVTGTGFGVTWRVSFARVSPPQRMTAAQVFADEIDEEVKAPTAHSTSAEVELPTFDEEEDSVPYSEAPSAPAAPPTNVAPPVNRRRKAVA
jgi:hypothetical protein